MSHFAVMVIGENPEEQLAPYQENNMGDCPSEYLEFNDIEPEYREKYETETTPMIRLADGSVHSRYDERFRQPKPGGHAIFDREFVLPEGAVEFDQPLNERYATFDDYAEGYCGFTKDEERGLYGYYENPNAKWDWYQLGGRWTGYFKLKPEVMQREDFANIAVGSPGLMTEPAKRGLADAALKSEIDFDGMREDAAAEAAKRYDAMIEATEGIEPPEKTWPQLRDSMDIEEARKIFNDDPWVLAVHKARLGSFMGCPVEEFKVHSGGREAYIQEARDSAITSFAVLKDGVWYERGQMGWWACVSDEKDAGDWNKEFTSLLFELPEDTHLAVYDCHI